MPKGVYQRVKSTDGDYIDRLLRAQKRPQRLLIDILSELPRKSPEPSIYRVRTTSGFILRGRH